MSRFELGLNIEYVKDWTIVDGVREIYQNALDQQRQSDDNDMFTEYDPKTETLLIGNKNSTLTTETLLLGTTTKAGDNKTIGQFGEGYKLAIIVLLRNNIKITIHNKNKKEDWIAKIVKSRRYNAEIPVIDIIKTDIFKRKDFDLIFELNGITNDMMEQIIEYNLHFQDYESIKLWGDNELLQGEEHLQKLYVDGLFVAVVPEMKFGYNLEPKYIKLGRDRNLVNSFDLKWQLSSLWNKCNNSDMIYENRHIWELTYINEFYEGSAPKTVAEKLHKELIEPYGENAVAVLSQSEYDAAVVCDKKPVIVSTADYEYLKKAKIESTLTSTDITDSLQDQFDKWCDSVEDVLTPEQLQKIKSLWHLANN